MKLIQRYETFNIELLKLKKRLYKGYQDGISHIELIHQKRLYKGYQDGISHIELIHQVGARHLINLAQFKIIINIEVDSLVFIFHINI